MTWLFAMSEWVTDFYYYDQHTDSAVCIAVDEESVPVWVPRSMIDTPDDIESLTRGDVIEVSMKTRVAQEKGLI